MTHAEEAFPGADFHRRATHALSLEWRLAAARLPDAMSRVFHEPGFALPGLQSILGQWVPQPVREIRIALGCVVNHPWCAVVDILKHEMAHQLADEVLGRGSNEPPHGETFQRACRLLRANPAASDTYPTLDQAILHGDVGGDDKIVAKIRKLLALAGSPNRHEAEFAMAKARELMARHCIDTLGATPPHYVTFCLGEPALRHGLEVHSLSSLVREFYFVTTIWVPMAIPEKGRMGRVLEVSGTPDNVRLAHYVFGFVQHVIEGEWQRYRRGRRMGTNGRRDFALGMIQGFRALLRQQTEESPEIAALVRRGDPALDAYFEERHPQRRTNGVGHGVRVNPSLLQAGKATAKRVGLRQGLNRGEQDHHPKRLGRGSRPPIG